MITKFCHNDQCQYVTQTDPEREAYAHSDLDCPACGGKGELKSAAPHWVYAVLSEKFWEEKRGDQK